MSDKLSSAAHRAVDTASSAAHTAHGTGDALRGTFNSTIDGLVPNSASREGGGREHNEAIAEKGLGEIRQGEEKWKEGSLGAGESPSAGGSGGVFKHGHTLRGNRDAAASPAATSMGNAQGPTATPTGQGQWLSKGGVRGDDARASATGSGANASGAVSMGDASSLTQAPGAAGNTDTAAVSQTNESGVGAARRAWSGQQGGAGMGQGAHSGSAGNMESNPVPIQDLGGEGETKREAF